MRNINVCEESLKKINKYFNNAFSIILNPIYTVKDYNNFNERLALYELFVKCNINLKCNDIVESEKTFYDIDTRTLNVNKEDNLEHVEFVIMRTIIERMFDKVEIKDVKVKFYALYYIFYTLGLLKESTSNLLCGSNHIMVTNFTKAVIACMK